MTYEEALKELEEILEALESEDITLEDSVKKFKRGVALYNYCSKILNNIEGEVKILIEDNEGNMLEEDFQVEV
ncbi:exodeoxyribonuclease VII small subunit [Keratinibaculum paraultunense]|nr:exodeoxyribonuclease VII small subunit [Keratinibaculum paraultunense]